jgi:capsule polysaccharide export protein KpsC/LpsZ
MIESHGPLDAWIAQGIAMAQLERLEQRAMRHVLDLARAAGLQATTYMEPDVATRSQQDLFDSVDAAALGVRLTEYGTMEPRLSYSFWLPLYPGTHDSQSGA